MASSIPTTGGSALLEQLSPFVPDDFINELVPRHSGRGRRSQWSGAQLYRVLLLALLTPAHSFNLVAELLKEQRAWRDFARLRNRHAVPVASQLHDFRNLLGVGTLRQINRHLLLPLLAAFPTERKRVALIDATDLPAATSAYKKN